MRLAKAEGPHPDEAQDGEAAEEDEGVDEAGVAAVSQTLAFAAGVGAAEAGRAVVHAGYVVAVCREGKRVW